MGKTYYDYEKDEIVEEENENYSCSYCGGYSRHLHGSIYGDRICEDCLLEHKADYKLFREIGEQETCCYELPFFFKMILSDFEIKEAIYKFIEENEIDYEAVIKDDFEWFSDRLEVYENENRKN